MRRVFVRSIPHIKSFEELHVITKQASWYSNKTSMEWQAFEGECSGKVQHGHNYHDEYHKGQMIICNLHVIVLVSDLV